MAQLLEFVYFDRYEVNLPVTTVDRLADLALKYGLSISLLIREVLSNPMKFEVPRYLKRPRKFEEKMHRFPVCFYGDDKLLWKVRLNESQSEFGALVRYMLEVYDQHLEEIASSAGFVAECVNLRTEFTFYKDRVRCGYQYHIYYFPFHKTKINSESLLAKHILGRKKIRSPSQQKKPPRSRRPRRF